MGTMNKFLIILVVYTISSIKCHYVPPTCLAQNYIKWNRHFHVDNQTLPIIIDVTNRISHKIISFILKILLIERLRYTNVTFYEIPWFSPFETMQRLNSSKNSSLSGGHINLELWQPPGFNVEAWVNKGLVLDCGPLGSIGSRGIFTPSETVDLVYYTKNKSIDHWRVFGYPRDTWNYSELYKWLTVNKSWVTVNNFSPKDVYNVPILLIDKKEYQKPLEDIFKNIFSKKTNVLLMINTTGSLKQTIDEWDQYSSKNPNLTMKSPLFFYNWYPNTITVNRKYNRVLFPDCYGITNNSLCDFEVNQLSKMVSVKLKSHATLVYQLVNKIKFTELELVSLLKKVKDENPTDDELYKIACGWLQEVDKWNDWITGWNVKQKLVIPGLYALYGRWVPDNLLEVSYNEVNLLNKKYFENSCYELVLDVRNLSCIEDLVLKEYLQYSFNANNSSIVLGFLAAVCSDSLVSTLKVATFQKRIIVTSTADSPNFGNVSQYKYFFRTIPSMHLQKTLLLKAFETFKWRRIAILRKDAMFYDSKIFEDHKMEVIEDFHFEDNFLTFDKAYETLKRMRDKNIRIFLVEYFAEATRIIMCAAYKLGMTLETGYVWFLNPWMNDNWNEQRTDNCSVEEIKNSTYKYFILAHRGLATYQDFRNGNVDSQFIEKSTNINPFATFTKEAIQKIGFATNKLLEENPSALSVLHTESVARKFISLISNSDGLGNSISEVVHGHWVLMARQGRQKLPLLTWEVSNLNPQNPHENIKDTIVNFEGKRIWGESNKFRPPTDGTILEENNDCIFGLRQLPGLSCSATALVFNAMILFPILIIIISCFLFFFRRLRKRQEEEGIRKPFEFLCEELADLDISGKDVVINRTVGKGNFGIVYGGEARRDNQWVLVAIKAISKKLDYRYKYEFLSEAKLMSNLNHENIVKLIGISLNPDNDMLYLIMEHVTGGDLKKFLIKRRVKAKEDPNNDKINPRRLTKFALDIASGLFYLHQNRYLHRDVACRNCLISSDYGIKVGDFGLARRITKFNRKGGTGYYRFSGLGAMPIRWLPPESLQFGIYSVATDVWSFGVTLFEIVTFGIFPFCGFEHEEVVDKVKRGYFTVANFLPEEFRKNKIFLIISKCCNYNPSDRFKSMQEIIDIFDQDPDCIVPSLTDNPPNLPNSGLSYQSNPMMAEPCHSGHKKLTLKLQKEPALSLPIQFNTVEPNSPNLSPFTPSEPFYKAFVDLEIKDTKSPARNIEKHIPVKSQSVEYIHLANPNIDYTLPNPTSNVDLELDLGYVTYKTAENSANRGPLENVSSNRYGNALNSKPPSNYLTATDKVEQCDNSTKDAKTIKPIANHSSSLDLSTDTGCSDIDYVMDKSQVANSISNDCRSLKDQCLISSVT